MVLVDTSVWIDLFSKRPSLNVPTEKLPLLVTCPPVIQEVLQGVGDDRALAQIKAGFLALTCVGNPLELETFLEAADLYRVGRRRGVTIRSATDCLIAALAMRHGLPVWHRDRDFAALAKFTALTELQRI